MATKRDKRKKLRRKRRHSKEAEERLTERHLTQIRYYFDTNQPIIYGGQQYKVAGISETEQTATLKTTDGQLRTVAINQIELEK